MMVKPPALKQRIDASTLIPGREPPIRGASLVFQDKQILWVGQTVVLPPEYAQLQAIATVPFLMPGMWDCHVHFVGASNYDIVGLASVAPALAGARAARDVAATLDAGFTSVRELAGYGIDLLPAIKDGWIKGPNIYSAGSIHSMTAGHDDFRWNPIELNKANSLRGSPFYVCDGVDECTKAVRMQVRRGAKVIKISTTGGVGSADSLESTQFSPAEIEAFVQEAARNDLIVAAHAHGPNGIKAAVRAGAKTIEHGSLADDECLAMMKEHDVILVATRTVQEYGAQHPELFSPEGYEKLKRANTIGREVYAKAIRAGVKIALGTDVALSSPNVSFQHGTNGTELGWAVEAGMSELEAIEAGTATAPETLGPQAPRSGQLQKGYDADFLAITADPLENIHVLAQPNLISHVWKGGVLMKQPNSKQ